MRIQRAKQRAAMSDSGQNQGSCGANIVAAIGGDDLGAKFSQRAFDRSDISRPVINHRNLHKSSLVLGSTLFKRLSRDTAKRSARANALKTAST